ncbi:thioredoxin family protein [Candidatus Gracilibacteria bacterium]|nr:thioredoxin family protein [Candidatus Gracilibacteria bacterium]MCF7819411.1 thioredoxin family protein [Candidatus Gracilibacteria bacterium]
MVLLHSVSVPLGSPMTDFRLPSTDGKDYSLASFSDKDILILVFTCNHCPYAQAIEERLIQFQKKYVSDGVQVIAINANDAEKYPEDSFEKMKDKNYPFPYLRDESQEVARMYKAQCTPDIYVYDRERKLAYHGRFDDNWQNEGGVTSHDLEKAVQVLLKGERFTGEQVPSMGCSIKWKE